jgi:hypothetical protein
MVTMLLEWLQMEDFESSFFIFLSYLFSTDVFISELFAAVICKDVSAALS